MNCRDPLAFSSPQRLLDCTQMLVFLANPTLTSFLCKSGCIWKWHKDCSLSAPWGPFKMHLCILWKLSLTERQPWRSWQELSVYAFLILTGHQNVEYVKSGKIWAYSRPNSPGSLLSIVQDPSQCTFQTSQWIQGQRSAGKFKMSCLVHCKKTMSRIRNSLGCWKTQLRNH